MKLSSRVFRFALLSGVIASVLLLLIQVFGNRPWDGVVPWYVMPKAFVGFVFLLIVGVLPASLPMTLVGGYIAARLVRKQQHRHSLGRWIARGCGCGFVFGALGSALWFGGMNGFYIWNAGWDAPSTGMLGPGKREMLEFVSFMASVGGLAGAVVGGAVGTYCWRATRSLPPNPPLNLTGAKSAPAG